MNMQHDRGKRSVVVAALAGGFLMTMLFGCSLFGPTVTVAVNPKGTGTVTLSPAGPTYNSGTSVTATATPSSGYVFTDWSGDETGIQPKLTFTVTKNTTITAEFVQGAPLTSVNASATLNGASFGSGTSSDASLQKTVTLVDDSPNSALQIGSSTTVFRTSGGTALYAAIPVKNVGSRALSFVEFSNVYYVDSNGTKLNGSPDTGYAYGSVGYLTPDIFDNSSLAPGQTGYVFLIALNVFSSTAKIEFTPAVGSSTPLDPGASLIPQSYSISGASGSSGTLTETFKNTSANQLDVNNQTIFFRFIALDANGTPVMWDSVSSNLTPSNGVLPAGTAGSMSDLYQFSGTSSSIIAFTSFETSSSVAKLFGGRTITMPNPRDFSSHAAWLKAVNEARNELKREKESFVSR